jgi:hypothetical protein
MSQMFLNVVSTFKGDGLAAATRQLGAFGQASNGLGATLGKVGAALASFGIAAKAVKFGRDSIESARDLERNLFSVNTIFDEFSPKIVQFTKDAQQLGLSQKDAAKASTFLGSVLKQSGFSMEFVTAETQKLVSLGVDLAATYGYDVQEALLGMTALFRGEYDPIEKFGVAMKQSEINAELVTRKLNHLTGAERRNAEQTIRLELLYQRAADATGAFGAQSGNLYVEQKKLQAQFENIQAQLGTELLPVFGKLVEALVPLVDDLTPRFAQVIQDSIPVLEAMVGTLKDMSDETTTTGQTFSTLSYLAGNTFRLVAENLGVIVQLAAVFATARVAVVLFNAALKVTPVAIWMTTIGSIIASVIVAADTFKRLRKEIDRAGDALTGFEKDSIAALGAMTGFNPLNNPMIKFFQEAIKLALRLSGVLDALPKEKVVNIRLETDVRNRQLGDYLGFLTGKAKQPGGSLFGTDGDGGGGDGGGKPAAAALSVSQQLQKTQALSVKQAEAQGKLLGIGLQQGVVDQVLAMSKPVKSANDLFKDLTKKNGELTKKGVKEVAKYNSQFNAGIEQVNQRNAQAAQDAIAAAQEAERLADQLREAEKARIAALDQLYANFLDSVKSTFAGIKNAIMGAFDITGLGGSTNAIIRNMNKLLAKMKDFSANVKSLATMGLDPALLQQIIQAGPVAGARLAGALVAGGAGALSQINAGFMQAGSLASEIATTGVQSLFDTQKQQSVYNITVTGGVGSGATIGKAIVDAIKDYERTSGAVWQGA